MVKEGKASDEVVISIHATNKLLGIMTKKFEGCDHGKTAVVELLGLKLLQLLRALVLGLSVTKDKEAIVVNSSDQKEHLEPAKSRDGGDGSDSTGDRCARNTWGNIEGEFVKRRLIKRRLSQYGCSK